MSSAQRHPAVVTETQYNVRRPRRAACAQPSSKGASVQGAVQGEPQLTGPRTWRARHDLCYWQLQSQRSVANGFEGLAHLPGPPATLQVESGPGWTRISRAWALRTLTAYPLRMAWTLSGCCEPTAGRKGMELPFRTNLRRPPIKPPRRDQMQCARLALAPRPAGMRITVAGAVS